MEKIDDSLREKMAELAALEKKTVRDYQLYAEETAKHAITGERMRLFNEALDDFFKTRIQSVQLITAKEYDNLTLKAVKVAVIVLPDNIELALVASSREYTYLRLNGQQLRNPLGYEIFDTNDPTYKGVLSILNHVLAHKVEPYITEFTGVFFGRLCVYLAKYADTMRLCPVKEHAPPSGEKLRRVWTNLTN